jgi:hypothetical protein
MCKTNWMLAVSFFLAAAVWAQQPETKPTPPPPTVKLMLSTPATGPDVNVPPACPAQFDDSLATDGIVGKNETGVTHPKPKLTPPAEFSDEARREIKKQHIKNFEAISVIGFVVDENGKPRDLCLKKAAGFGLDAQAAKAVWQYRLAPATKDGKPVAARLTVEVNFRLY